jgi:UPF0716 family protein affecting phage T7 exclusion
VRSPSRRSITVHAIAIVQRTEDGTLRVKEGKVDDFPVATWTATAIGAAIGGLIVLTPGVLGGPLGFLLFAPTLRGHRLVSPSMPKP